MITKGSKKSAKLKKPNVDNKEINDFIEFFKIEFKTDEEMAKMSKQMVRQYECRTERWHSLIESHIDFEIYKSLHLFSNLNLMVEKTNDKIQEIRSDPQFETKHNKKYKNELSKVEDMSKQVVKQLAADRKTFDEIHISFREMRAEKERAEKKEKEIENEDNFDIDIDIEDKSDSDVEIKEEYISEDDDEDLGSDGMDIKSEDSDEESIIKEEYISEESNDCKDFKKEVIDIDDKSVVKTELDFKPIIKTEIKSEIKSEIKDEIKTEVKKEYISEEEESD